MDMNNKISSHEEASERPQAQSPPTIPRQNTLTTIMIGFLMVFSIFSVGKEIRDQLYPRQTSRVITKNELTSWGQALDSIVSPETVEALGNDPKLRRALISMVDYTVDLSGSLAERYESPQLEETRQFLAEYQEKIRRSLEGLGESLDTTQSEQGSRNTKRQFPGFGGLFSAAAGGEGGGGGPPNPFGLPLPGAAPPGAAPSGGAGGGGGLPNPLGLPGLPGAPGGGGGGGLLPGTGGAGGDGQTGGILAPLLQPLTDGLKNVGNQLVQNLNGPAMFLGIGVGAGAAQGLNLSTTEKTLQVAAKVAADNNMEATGLNPAIQNLGVGLTSTLIGAVDLNSLGGNLTNQLQPIAMSLATGLGNGTVAGLKINANVNLEPVNDSSIPNVIGTFGFGLTKSVAANIDINSLFNQANNPNTTRAIMRFLPAAASGFGKGLGQGATVGLGLQPDSAVPMQQMPDGQIDFGGISQTFAKGLTSSFLQNGTAGELVNKLGSSMNMQKNGGGIPATINFNGQTVEVSRVAQGFARGFLQGAGDAIQGMGGVQSLIQGNATMPAGGLPDSKVQFDDSLGGAASGFGVGIGGQGVLVVSALVANPQGTPMAAANPPAAAPPAAATPSAPPTRRSLGVVSRQDQPQPAVTVNTTNGFNLSVVINAQTVSMAAQAGVNALTCQGVGGLGLVFLGLVQSKTVPLDTFNSGGNVTKVLKQAIPTGIIKLANEGNFYAIDGQVIRDSLGNNILGAASGVEINGMKLPGWIAFLVLHILFAIVAYINVLPLALGLEHMRNLLLRVNVPQVLPNVQKWNNIMWLFILAPSMVVVLIFGVLVFGKSAHFRTAHGIISLITTLVGIGAFLMHLAIKARAPPALPNSSRSPPAPLLSLPNIRVYVNQLFLILSFASVITGFADLSAVALCFTQVVPFDLALVLGFGLSTLFVLGSTVSGLDIALMVRDAFRYKKGLTPSGAAVESGTAKGGVVSSGRKSPPTLPMMSGEKGNFA